jgi:antitoxin (DNA-binding transcriptional repressor) of toxin-antitoxin stability system
MKAISVSEFYSNFQKYLTIILRGENIVLSRNKKKIALIEPIKEKTKRPFGLCKGEFTLPDNFNEPLPESIITTFHN